MSYPLEYIRALLYRADIAQVASTFMELRTRGKYHQESVGLCPIHSEKTPSFVVHRQRQFWHCLGCGYHGNVITFLMQQQKMSYGEAVRYLAKRYHYHLKQWKRDEKRKEKR